MPEHAPVKLLDEELVQDVRRPGLLQPCHCLDDIVLLPAVQLAARRYVRETQSLGFVGIEGSGPSGYSIPSCSLQRFEGNSSTISSTISDRTFLFPPR